MRSRRHFSRLVIQLEAGNQIDKLSSLVAEALAGGNTAVTTNAEAGGAEMSTIATVLANIASGAMVSSSDLGM